jgi:uncharacterized protein (TIGR03032 family)
MSARGRRGAAPAAGESWRRGDIAWRDPGDVVALWPGAGAADPALFRHQVRGDWWDLLAATGSTLLVTREYEHLVMALTCDGGAPLVTYLPLPHPSGVAVDAAAGKVFVASTRNPNQLVELAPVRHALERLDAAAVSRRRVPVRRPLVPVRSTFLPGCTYLHDLAIVGGRLHATAVGQNAVVELAPGRELDPVWWPRCIEVDGLPVFGRNHIQLNSIAAGRGVGSSFFTASAETMGTRRPGHRNFAVDRRGVVFSGETREPIARGLTRPHSARLHGGALWVDNSGYGELSRVEGGVCGAVARLPGWTRGLCFHGDLAFVGTSRVIPRFRSYAPGLDDRASTCAIHAVDTRSGAVLASLRWPHGSQIFALELVPREMTCGFPFSAHGRTSASAVRRLFFAFSRRHREAGSTDG